MSEECNICGTKMDEYFEQTVFICPNGNCEKFGIAFRKKRIELKSAIAESKTKIVAEVNRLRRLKKELRELGMNE